MTLELPINQMLLEEVALRVSLLSSENIPTSSIFLDLAYGSLPNFVNSSNRTIYVKRSAMIYGFLLTSLLIIMKFMVLLI